jgi:hypothetical protein
MTVLDALGNYLVSNGIGTLATTIFLARMPDSPDACVTLYESQGAGGASTFGAGVTAFDVPRIRVLCRAGRNDYQIARAKAVDVRNLLGAVRKTTLSGVGILTILATSEVYPMGRDGDDRPIIGCDYSVWLS